MANAIITLTTDYGINDHLVGTLKGVILKINPDVTIVDITHNVAIPTSTRGMSCPIKRADHFSAYYIPTLSESTEQSRPFRLFGNNSARSFLTCEPLAKIKQEWSFVFRGRGIPA